jgi:hypothetical protein
MSLIVPVCMNEHQHQTRRLASLLADFKNGSQSRSNFLLVKVRPKHLPVNKLSIYQRVDIYIERKIN